jgi:trimethylamine-N-oxide reductase (cytochrome c)
MNGKKLKFEVYLFGLTQAMKVKGRQNEAFRKHLLQRDCTVQIRLKDRSQGRYFIFTQGRIKSSRGLHAAPDVSFIFKDLDTALTLMAQPVDHAESIHAAKNFKIQVEGEDEPVAWFMQILGLIGTSGWDYGTKMPDGSRRYTNLTNGGPLFVHVKDGKIIRINTITYDKEDAGEWSIEARGKTFTPLPKATVAPHALALKSLVYSDDRLLYPMKRVDFDPAGERNPQNRGTSGYERISWDEALDIVGGEILRMKSQYGPGAIGAYNSSHHQWGNLNYYLSSFMRFGNAIGVTRVHHNPDSWEGWYWGAMHHHGASMRLGNAAGYGTLEDCLRECEMIVYWSSDRIAVRRLWRPGSAARLWGKELGINRSSAHYCRPRGSSAAVASIRPGADNALAIAIMYVWITEACTTGTWPRRPPASMSGAPMSSARRTASPRRRNGSSRRRGLPPGTCGRWRANGGGRRPISPRVSPALASAAPAGGHRASNGRGR